MYVKLFLVAIAAFVIDQASKWYVVWQLDLLNAGTITVWPPFLMFRMAWNEGINFGFLSLPPWVLISVALAICAGVLYWAREFKGWFAAILFGLIIGGALGNALDRAMHGAVADFLNMSCCGFDNPFSFNLADVFVFAGAIGLLIFGERLPKRA